MNARTNEKWLTDLRGAHGAHVQRLAFEDLARYLTTVAYNYLRMRQHELPVLAALDAEDAVALAQDFVQDLLEKIALNEFTLLNQFRGDGRFTAWVAVILRRHMAKELKRKRWTQPGWFFDEDVEAEQGGTQLLDPALGGDPHFWAQINQINAVLQKCLQLLTLKEYTSFVRCIGEGDPAEVVAQMLTITVNAVNLAVFKAKRKLRTCLRNAGIDVDDLQLFTQFGKN